MELTKNLLTGGAMLGIATIIIAVSTLPLMWAGYWFAVGVRYAGGFL